MAQTGYTPISIYYSSTSGNTPTSGNLVAGELAINTADGKLFYKDSSGVVQVIAGKGGAGVAGGSNTQVQYNSGGSLAGSANMIFDGTTLTLANNAAISGLTVGKGSGNVAQNSAFGAGALGSTNTGAYNTGLGFSAGGSLTSGATNTFVGAQAGNQVTTGSDNTAVGTAALLNTTTGGQNTAIGRQALQLNTTASNNTAVGYQAGYSNTTGNLTSLGYQALYANTTGSEGVAVGASALRNNTTGNYNISVGDNSLYTNTTGANNVGIGHAALFSNTTASNNTAVGYQAGYSGTTAASNTFIGAYTGYSITTGTANTFIGNGQNAAGYYVTTGSKNTILGGYSGNNGGLDIRTASNYIVLSDGDGNPRQVIDSSGRLLVGNTTTVQSSTAEFTSTTLTPSFLARSNVASDEAQYTGQFQKKTATNTTSQIFVRFLINDGATPSGYITANGANAATFTSSSDARLKENIVDLPSQLDNIVALRPVEFDYKDGSGHQVGFIAQEMQTVYPDSVSEGVDGMLQIGGWSKTEARLVKAIQELTAKVESLEAQLKGK